MENGENKIYDFNKYPESYRYYGGSDNKYSIVIDGNNYMIKLPNRVPSKNSLNTSYTNSTISEYIACKTIKTMGLWVQDVLSGDFAGSIYRIAKKI